MQYYQTDNFTLYNGNTMNLLADNVRQVDMIFADPPYFLSKGFTMKSKGRV